MLLPVGIEPMHASVSANSHLLEVFRPLDPDIVMLYWFRKLLKNQ